MDLKNNQIKIGEILKNPLAKKVIDKEFPGLTKNPLINLYTGLSLEKIIKKFGNKVSDQQFERLKNELEKI